MADVNINKFRASVVRDGSKPASPGFIVSEGQDPVNPPGTNNYVPYSGATANVELGEYGVEAGFITLDTTPTNTPTDQGTIFWDADDETVDIVLNGYTMKIGEDLFYPVKNQTGSTIAKGVAVRFNGTVGASGRLLIAPFIADGSVPSSRFMGVTAEEILNGEDGKVLYFGRVRGINTNAFNEGDILYASTTVAGGYQTAIPVAPNNIVQVAAVVTKSATVGTIFVRPTLGSNINKDEGVKITSVADKNLLQYQSGTSLWENKSLAQVLGGTSAQFVKGDGSLDSTSYGTGTVTSVGLSSATSGVTIGSTPVTTSGTITLAIATASGSQNGLLSSTDWTTFNNKQNALTNPVTGTGTTNYLPKFTGASTIGNSQIFDNGTNIGIRTTSPLSAGTYYTTLELKGATGGSGNEGGYYLTTDADGSTIGQLGVDGNFVYVGSRSNTDAVITSNNTERIRVFAGGNVHIGPIGASDNGARLQVSGTATFSSSVTATSAIFSSTITNNVYTTPGSIANPFFNDVFLFGFGGAYSKIQWGNEFNNTYGSYLRFIVNGASNFNTPITALTLSPSGAATFSSSVTSSFGSSGANFNSNAATTGSVNAYRASNSVGVGSYGIEANSGNNLMTGGLANATLLQSVSNTALQFGTNQTARMTITSSGNVGINTGSPVGGGGAGDRTLAVNANAGSASFVTGMVNGTRYSTLFTSTTDVVLETNASIPLILSTNSTERMRITSIGDVLMGKQVENLATAGFQFRAAAAALGLCQITRDNSEALHLNRLSSDGSIQVFFRQTVAVGSISVTGSATSYNTSSDYRLKEDLQQVNGLEKINAINVYNYKWKNSNDRMDGVLAHELAEVLPYAVIGQKDGIQMQGVDYSKIVPLLIQSIQELKQEIDTLKN